MARAVLGYGLVYALVGAFLCGSLMGEEPAKAARDKGKPTKVDSSKDDPSKDDPSKDHPASKGKARLTPRQINFVKKELIPASQSGDPKALLALLSPQLAKLSEAHRQAMDALLAEQGEPGIGALLTTARMQLFRAKSEAAAPELSLPEAVLILADVSRQIDELLTAAKKSSVMADPLPKPDSLLGYRDLLFEVHVQKNQLKNLGELSEFGKAIDAALPDARRKTATEEQRKVLAISFRTFDAAAAELDRDLTERSLEMRLNRLDLAVEVLEANLGLKEKFFAAYAIGVDGEFLLAGFKAGGNAFRRPALRKENLVDELSARLEKGKMLAGDLIDKGRNLFIGLHWWRRGRYGRGPEGMGLLKSVAATKSFEASVPLFMPAQSPVPTDPIKFTSQQAPDYDRRHHYTWAWEDRQFQNTLSTQSSSQELGRHSTETKYFY